MISVHPPVEVVPPTMLSTTDLVRQKRGRTISVCLPARNEETTVGPIVEAIVYHLMAPNGPPLVDDANIPQRCDGGADDRELLGPGEDPGRAEVPVEPLERRTLKT